MPPNPAPALSDSIANLHISSPAPATPPRRKPKPPVAEVAESWDDGLESDAEEEKEAQQDARAPAAQPAPQLQPPPATDEPRAPPPTPVNRGAAKPTTDWRGAGDAFGHEGYGYGASGQQQQQREEKRPEKSTAVASRLIAAGLGVRAPRRTEGQREYDRAVRAQERKKKEKEAEEEKRRLEERERAKAAVWED